MHSHYVIRLRGVTRGFSPNAEAAARLAEALDAASLPGASTYERREGPMPDNPDLAAAELRAQDEAMRARQHLRLVHGAGAASSEADARAQAERRTLFRVVSCSPFSD